MTSTLTLAQRDKLITTWRDRDGVSQPDYIERVAHALAELTLRLLPPQAQGPIVTVAGLGEVGAVGMAVTRLLHMQGVAVRLVVAGRLDNLDAATTTQYQQVQAAGLSAWALSLTEEEMEAQEPIDWMRAALIVDCLLDLHLTADPHEDTADLIRIINTTRRPILAYAAPSGLGGDDGIIYSPCVKASATLTHTLPDHGLVEGWPVVGDVWLANVGVPLDLVLQVVGYDSLSLLQGATLVSLGPARQLARQ